MRLAKVRLGDGSTAVARVEGESVHILDTPLSLSALLHSEPFPALESKATERASEVTFLPPIDEQEVWAAGVTYVRSKVAREEESATSGGSRFYDMVYTAPRPELFLKAPAWRVVGDRQPVRIRKDATWNVPEPELALMLSPAMKVVGFTIGNDMSSRDIEGENPLYLPQAKLYDGCCALGPVVTLAGHLPSLHDTKITLIIRRNDRTAFEGTTSPAMLKRSFDELAGWLGKELSFPHGAVLLTGTGIVPPDGFTLEVGDEVRIDIAGIGTLSNPVA
ncbi:MAG: fumarylacetoacetate hydrolase family protein [Gemmataceae bacterium]|nr:fumarylacetoacetate hydrolase family protein [Gemmataceae bacterium]